MRITLAALLLALLAACSSSKLEETMLTKQEQRFIRAVVADVSRGDAAAVERKSPPEVARQLGTAFIPMRNALPSPPHEFSLANANVSLTGDTRTLSAVYTIKGGNGWALLEVVTETIQGKIQLDGIYLTRSSVDPLKQNEFNLAKGGTAGLAMIVAMAAAVALTIAAIVRIWRSGLFQRRWVWTIGAIIGFSTLRMNWATGEFSFQPISVQLFSASALKAPPFSPWVLGVSLPLVALIVLFRRELPEGANATD